MCHSVLVSGSNVTYHCSQRTMMCQVPFILNVLTALAVASVCENKLQQISICIFFYYISVIKTLCSQIFWIIATLILFQSASLLFYFGYTQNINLLFSWMSKYVMCRY